MRTIGACDAKTHLATLLDEVACGESLLITKRGRPVAVLGPVPAEPTKLTVPEVVQGLRELRSRYSLGGLKPKDLIDEGRNR